MPQNHNGNRLSATLVVLTDLIDKHFASLPDSQQQRTALDLVVSIRDHLQMLGTEIDLTTYALDEQEISLRNLRGKLVLVEFWSTTCCLCMADFPAPKRIYITYHDHAH